MDGYNNYTKETTPTVPSNTLSPMNELLVLQMKHELTNSMIYLNFSNICDCKGLFGSAKFFLQQSNDETRHFNIIRNYLCDRIGFVPELRGVDPLSCNISLVLADMIDQSLDLEVLTTSKLIAIQKEALMDMDMMTFEVISDLVKEQREEEKTFSDLANRFTLLGDSPTSILLLDQELGARG